MDFVATRTQWWHSLALVLLVASCSDSDSDSRVDASTSTPVDASTIVSEDAAPQDANPFADAAVPVHACQAAGGICLGRDESSCTSQNGTREPAGDESCTFDDGPGVCCVPPPAQESGDTCESRGGLV